jgi:hypothetical protein
VSLKKEILVTLQNPNSFFLTIFLQGLFFNLVGIWIQRTHLQGFENLAGKHLENHFKNTICISTPQLMKNQTFSTDNNN